MSNTRHKIYEAFTAAAKKHGEESEPEHEVGDLQQAFEITLRYVPDHKLKEVMNTLIDEVAIMEEDET